VHECIELGTGVAAAHDFQRSVDAAFVGRDRKSVV
jgi:hypothetical protein